MKYTHSFVPALIFIAFFALQPVSAEEKAYMNVTHRYNFKYSSDFEINSDNKDDFILTHKEIPCAIWIRSRTLQPNEVGVKIRDFPVDEFVSTLRKQSEGYEDLKLVENKYMQLYGTEVLALTLHSAKSDAKEVKYVMFNGNKSLVMSVSSIPASYFAGCLEKANATASLSLIVDSSSTSAATSSRPDSPRSDIWARVIGVVIFGGIVWLLSRVANFGMRLKQKQQPVAKAQVESDNLNNNSSNGDQKG